MGQKFLSFLERCPPCRGLNWKVPKFKVRLFYTGSTLTRTPPPPFLTMGMWNGDNFFCNVSVYLTSKVKVVSYFLLLSISDDNVLQLFSYHFQRFIYFAILILPICSYCYTSTSSIRKLSLCLLYGGRLWFRCSCGTWKKCLLYGVSALECLLWRGFVIRDSLGIRPDKIFCPP